MLSEAAGVAEAVLPGALARKYPPPGGKRAPALDHHHRGEDDEGDLEEGGPNESPGVDAGQGVELGGVDATQADAQRPGLVVEAGIDHGDEGVTVDDALRSVAVAR